VHATEPTIRPEKAEACADHLGASIPGASHIQHMPSHTYNRIGRWGDAVRSNLAAWHSDQRAEEDIAWAIYPSHNLHMLLFAASMDGQGAVAMQAARDYGKIVPGGAFYEAMTMLRFGRFDEILELDDPPAGGIQRGFWDFARGYAYLRNDEPERASVYLERVRRAAEKPPTASASGVIRPRTCWVWSRAFWKARSCAGREKAAGPSRCWKPRSSARTDCATTSPSR